MSLSLWLLCSAFGEIFVSVLTFAVCFQLYGANVFQTPDGLFGFLEASALIVGGVTIIRILVITIIRLLKRYNVVRISE